MMLATKVIDRRVVKMCCLGPREISNVISVSTLNEVHICYQPHSVWPKAAKWVLERAEVTGMKSQSYGFWKANHSLHIKTASSGAMKFIELFIGAVK